MNRRQFLRTGLLAGAALAGAPMLNLGRCRLLGSPGPAISTRAADLVLGARVIDMLSLLTLDWPKLLRWHQGRAAFVERDFRALEIAGIDILHPAVETSSADPAGAAERWIGGWNSLLGSQGCFLARVDSPATLRAVPQQGKLGVILGFQNSNHFRTAEDVAAFYRRGQRLSQLTYNSRNELGSGCYEARDDGLSPFGAAVVAEMNRLGMAIDVSHCGERTSRDAIAASRQPVLATHSNCRALVAVQPRCKSDSLIRELAARGGVMGITMVRPFVSSSSSPNLDHVLDHFDHVARLVGVEHVGLGSDVDVTGIDPATGRRNPIYDIAGLEPRARVFQIADGLLRRGWSGRAIELILGENFRRALGEIWKDSKPRNLPTRRDPFCPAPRRRVPRVT